MDYKRLRQLLFLLNEDEYTPAQSMVTKLNLSSKTIRSLLKEADCLLNKNGASIIVKHGCGYRLQKNDRAKFDEYLSSFNTDTLFANTSNERMEYILAQLMNTSSYITLSQLEEALYITRNTLTADIKKLEQPLKKYNLKLIRKARHGIRLDGGEMDIRLFMASLLSEQDYNFFVPLELREQISECIQPIFTDFNFSISELSYQSLVPHICVAVTRIIHKSYIDEPLPFQGKLAEMNEYKTARALASALEKSLSAAFPQIEILYLTALLASMHISKDNDTVSSRISSIVEEMLEEVKRSLNIDVKNDNELKTLLGQHLAALEIRVRYGFCIKNQLLDEIRKNYALAYQMATQACTVINRHFGKKIDDDEIGYIAFSFGLALENRKTRWSKKNILLVCSMGKASANLLKCRYLNEFGSQINKIISSDVNDVRNIDFSDIDYVISTAKIQDTIPAPILEVNYFLSDSERSIVRSALSARGKATEYYTHEMFIPRLSAKTRYEVISKMCEHIGSVLDLPDGFYEAILRREKLARTEFGNLIAMPHPDTTITSTTFVCVAVLAESILWEEKEVQVVFLVSVEQGLERDLQPFYNMTSKFLLSEECVRKLIQTRDYDSLMDMLSSFG